MNSTLTQRISSTKHLGHQIPKSGRFQRHDDCGDGQKLFLKNCWRGWCEQEQEAAFSYMFWHFMECLVKAEQQGCADAAEPAAGGGSSMLSSSPGWAWALWVLGLFHPELVLPLQTRIYSSQLPWAAGQASHPSIPRCISGNLAKPGLPLPGLRCASLRGHSPTPGSWTRPRS